MMFALMLAATATGALMPLLMSQLFLADVINERQVLDERVQKLRSDAEETRVLLLANHKLREDSGNGSVVEPDNSYVDRVIDDLPSDTTARTLYYELA